MSLDGAKSPSLRLTPHELSMEWITAVITSSGYIGIALLMFAENLFPPIPSELILPFAGYVAARGELHPVGVVAAGVTGSLLGAIPWYLAGRWLGGERLKHLADRHGRWLTTSRHDLQRAEGALVVVFVNKNTYNCVANRDCLWQGGMHGGMRCHGAAHFVSCCRATRHAS
jgi:membrane protein YqaA with SNARE-associated domain